MSKNHQTEKKRKILPSKRKISKMKVLKWIKWFFDFDRENEELNKDAKYQITQMGKQPHVIEWFAMMKKK